MAELRRDHQRRLAALEDRVLSMGNRAQDMLTEAMRALADDDIDRAAAVIRADDLLDEDYRSLQSGVFTSLALQAPVASELRLLAALIHVNIHVERVGDLCVNIAKFVGPDLAAGQDADMAAQLQEMGGHARRVFAKAVESFSRRDVELARRLPELDDPIDQLNRSIFRHTVELAADDRRRLDWSLRMVLMARYLERIGDHAVDIAEQTIFAVTGETVELASNSPTPP